MATITKQNIISYAQWRYGNYAIPKRLNTMTVEEILKEYKWSNDEVQKYITCQQIACQLPPSRVVKMTELEKKLDEAANNLENYVNNVIKNFNLDEVALQLDVTDRIDFIFGLPIRHDRKTISCNPVIEKEVWELLRDKYSDLALPL